MQLLAS